MQTLSLSPLPFDHSEESRSHRLLRSEGFVDEEVVSGLIAHGLYERAFVQPEDMVLSSSEDDYAGWALPVPSPFRGMRDEPQPASPAPWRSPAPPVPSYSEDGIETAYVGGHRWWLFGVSGAMVCALLALTLLNLAQRAEVPEIAAGFVPVPIKAEVPAVIAAEPALQPTLTKAQTDFP